tara:strand:+ start:9410 stop:9577 length:168 start_codon:yes stop_codon:yes gene_type:complete
MIFRIICVLMGGHYEPRYFTARHVEGEFQTGKICPECGYEKYYKVGQLIKLWRRR